MALDPNLSYQEEARMNPNRNQYRTARIPWLARYARGATMVVFTAIAAAISYSDGLYLIRFAGAAGRVAYMYPLLPDGLILISSIRLYEAAPWRPAWAMAGVIIGVGLTLAMNVGAGVLHNWMYALADACVPVVFFVALEILRGAVKRGRGGASPHPAPVASGQPEPAGPVKPEAALLALIGTGSRRDIAALLGVPKTRVDRWHARLNQPPASGPEEAEAEANDAEAAGDFEPPEIPVAALNGSGS
jgi:hypothetical protein